jgi:hypothetical protein
MLEPPAAPISPPLCRPQYREPGFCYVIRRLSCECPLNWRYYQASPARWPAVSRGCRTRHKRAWVMGDYAKPHANERSGLYIRSPNGTKVRDQRVRHLVRRMRASMPWLCDADTPTCRGWAELEVLATRAYGILATVPLINRDGVPLRLLSDFRLLRQLQLSYAAALGMTPLARKALQANGRAPLDLAAAMANGDIEDVESEPEKSPQSG